METPQFSPADSSLILEGSEERRKYLNGVISQYDREYLLNIIKYNKILQHRNKLLKEFHLKRYFEADSLDVWDEQLVILGEKIHRVRQEFLQQLMPIFQYYYNFIADGHEKVQLLYESQLIDNDFRKILTDARERDRIIQYLTL